VNTQVTIFGGRTTNVTGSKALIEDSGELDDAIATSTNKNPATRAGSCLSRAADLVRFASARESKTGEACSEQCK
jgi:hypothetical protein